MPRPGGNHIPLTERRSWAMRCGRIVLLLSLTCVLAVALQPNIVIEDNVITGNGFGIYLGWYGKWYVHVSGNLIEKNGEGIRIVNRRALIEGNTVADNVVGILVTAEHEEKMVTEVEKVILRGNAFERNELYAVQNKADVPLIAHGNWWGSPDGPRRPGVPAQTASQMLWSVWILPAGGLDCGLSLKVSLTTGDKHDLLLPLGAWTLAPWTWWNSACWGLPVTCVVLIVSGGTTVPRWGNLVTGPLQCDTWLQAPLNGRD